MTFWFAFRKFANRHQILERSSSTSTIYWCNLLRWLLNWCHLSTGSWMESLRALITMVWFISLDARVANTLSGLELARLADFPPDVLIEGRRVAAKLADSEKRNEEHSQTSKIAIRRKALLRVNSSTWQIQQQYPSAELFHSSFEHNWLRFLSTHNFRRRNSWNISPGFNAISRRCCEKLSKVIETVCHNYSIWATIT